MSSVNDKYFFNTGHLYLTVGGVAHRVGTVSDVEVDIELSVEDLSTGRVFPIDSAVKGGKLSVKATQSEIDGALIAALLNTTPAVGSLLTARETFTGTSLTLAHTPVNVFGVRGSDGTTYTLTTGTLGAGQYTLTAGAVAVASNPGAIAVEYEYSAVTGTTITVSNSDGYQAPTVEARFFNTYAGREVGVRVFALVVPKVDLAFKAGAFATGKLEGTAKEDSLGRVFSMYSSLAA